MKEGSKTLLEILLEAKVPIQGIVFQLEARVKIYKKQNFPKKEIAKAEKELKQARRLI